MDHIDNKIIKILQEDSRISITDLSKMVNLSRPSVKERIDVMVEKGVIEFFTIVVDPKKIGRKVVFYIEISELTIPHNVFVDKIIAWEFITEIYAVTGKNNYLMKASAPTVEDMNKLLEDLMPYGRVETSVVLNSPLKRKVILPFE